MSTPNANLPQMPAASFQPSIPYNEAMQIIDALLPLAVQTTTATPPTTVLGDVGKRWIIGSSATGDWTGHDGKIALCSAPELWVIIEPPNYIKAYRIDNDTEYRNMSGTWTAL